MTQGESWIRLSCLCYPFPYLPVKPLSDSPESSRRSLTGGDRDRLGTLASVIGNVILIFITLALAPRPLCKQGSRAFGDGHSAVIPDRFDHQGLAIRPVVEDVPTFRPNCPTILAKALHCLGFVLGHWDSSGVSQAGPSCHASHEQNFHVSADEHRPGNGVSS